MTLSEEKRLNRQEIKEAWELLQSFKKDGFYTVPKITWWVLNYKELATYTYEKRHEDSCYEGLSCPCSWDSPENRFHTLYATLQEVVDFHQYENYFGEELEVLDKVRDDYRALMQWLKKNEKLGAEDFLLFWIDWVDEEKTRVDPLITSEKDLGIKFQTEEWKNTIRFLEEFNELYWESEVCTKINS